jgi:hypothetical protein
MRPALPALVVALCLVLAGCAGAGGQTIDSPTSTDTTTTDTTTTTTGPPGSAIVDYDELDSNARWLFETALDDEGGTVETTNTTSSEFEPFVDHKYVRYEGNLYDINWDRDRVPETVVVEATATNGSELAENRSVVEYAGLSERGQEDFLAILNEEELSVSYELGESPFSGEPISGPTGYVLYEGTHYELSLAQGHSFRYKLVISEAIAVSN